MQKNKVNLPTICLSKKLFIETIEVLKKQDKHDSKCSDAFKVILPSDYVSFYDNDIIKQQLIKMLKIHMNDNNKDSWIEYFIYDLEYGTKYKDGCANYKDGTPINISTSANLYDFLLSEIE